MAKNIRLNRMAMHKILLISDDADHATNNVIDWLIYYKVDFLRTDTSMTWKLEKFVISDNQANFIISNKEHSLVVDTEKSPCFWHRKGRLTLEKVNPVEYSNFPNGFSKYLSYEQDVLNKGIIYCLNQKKGIGPHLNGNPNKLEVLIQATKVGLNIPNTIVTTNKSDIQGFIEDNGKIISKACGEVISYFEEGYNGLTQIIEKEDINSLDDNFFPTLFQQCIEKRFEVRTFYLDGKFFSMAIFSQLDDTTKIDFRNYNTEKPNRGIRLNLPKELEIKLTTLMKSLNFKSGSIDLIYGYDKKFYFLEVNPVGQFSQVSYPCNYNLEREIALYLIHNFKQ